VSALFSVWRSSVWSGSALPGSSGSLLRTAVIEFVG
jgi:hypothetical protein